MSCSGGDSLRKPPETAMAGTELADSGLKVGRVKVRPQALCDAKFTS
jgi:hypothetical protein